MVQLRGFIPGGLVITRTLELSPSLPVKRILTLGSPFNGSSALLCRAITTDQKNCANVDFDQKTLDKLLLGSTFGSTIKYLWEKAMNAKGTIDLAWTFIDAQEFTYGKDKNSKSGLGNPFLTSLTSDPGFRSDLLTSFAGTAPPAPPLFTLDSIYAALSEATSKAHALNMDGVVTVSSACASTIYTDNTCAVGRANKTIRDNVNHSGFTSASFFAKICTELARLQNVVLVPVGASQVILRPGESTNLSAVAKCAGIGPNTVTWSKNGSGNFTQLSGNSATYQAPNVTSTQTVIIRATSTEDLSKYGEITLTLLPNITVALDPSTPVNLTPSQTQTFYATVNGCDPRLVSCNELVNWSLSLGNSNVTGIQDLGNNIAKVTAPSTSGTYTLTATSRTDTTKSASTIITVGSQVQGSRQTLAAGDSHTLSLKADGTVWSWGANYHGQLGDGTTTSRISPVQVVGLDRVVAVSAGSAHSMALKDDGTIWAWGYNGEGTLGNGATSDSLVPVQVHNLSHVVAIAAGGLHSLALKDDGTISAWGWNFFGQLGDGTMTSRNTPVQLSGLSGVKALDANSAHSVALLSDGTVWTWGYNQDGRLGDGTTTDRHSPVRVIGLIEITAVAAGGSDIMALKSDGTVWSWGSNNFGELGDGTKNQSSIPVQVSGLSGVKAINPASAYSLALKSDGTVWNWGSNIYGRLGDGTIIDHLTPALISSLSDVVAVAAKSAHSLALKADGIVWGWGDNGYGQLGDGTFTGSLSPVQSLMSGVKIP